MPHAKERKYAHNVSKSSNVIGYARLQSFSRRSALGTETDVIKSDPDAWVEIAMNTSNMNASMVTIM